MSYGRPDQPDHPRFIGGWDKPYNRKYHFQKRYRWFHWKRKWQIRRERRRAKANPECDPEYGLYKGYE
jgi:hypothetical protein